MALVSPCAENLMTRLRDGRYLPACSTGIEYELVCLVAILSVEQDLKAMNV